jgi:excisionase family DNA binding protein
VLRRGFGFRELSEAYGNSESFWRMLVKSGKLKGLRFGRRVVVPVEALEAYLAEAAEPVANTPQALAPTSRRKPRIHANAGTVQPNL